MQWVFNATVAAAGLCIGSFLNVVILRGPALWGYVDAPEGDRGGLAVPRSYCPECRSPIRRRDLIPLFSYAALGGRCAACKAKISPAYPLVELAAALCALASVWAFGWNLNAALVSVALFLLIALFEIDRRTSYLPSELTAPLLWLGLLSNLDGRFAPLSDAVIGAAAGSFSFWLIASLYRIIRGRDGLGGGDASLLGAIGAWVGWSPLPVVVAIGALSTLAVVLVLTIRGGKFSASTALPFGPGLCVGGAAALLAQGIATLAG